MELPEEAWAYSYFELNADETGGWWVFVNLWTAEEGRSNLTLEAVVWDDGRTVTARAFYAHVM